MSWEKCLAKIKMVYWNKLSSLKLQRKIFLSVEIYQYIQTFAQKCNKGKETIKEVPKVNLLI